MTVAAHLQELIKQKKALANNLVEKGVQASEDEKFNTLVPKVLDISGGSSNEDVTEEVTQYSSLNDELEAVINSLPNINEGGEDVTEEVKEYTLLNTELETIINSLPNINEGGGGSNGQPLEVNELPAVGVEGTFYKVVKTEEANQVWMYAPSQQANTELKEAGMSYTLEIVDDFPNDPLITDIRGTVTFYYIKSMNNLYVYVGEWMISQDLFSVPFCGFVSSTDEFAEEGMYVVSGTSVTIVQYLFENGKYITIVGDGSYKALADFFTHPDILKEITLPADWNDIPSGAFKEETHIIKVTIPKYITEINSSSFNGCTGLTKVIFEEGSQLTEIQDYVFLGCTSLTSIEIPSGVTYMGYAIFSNCTKLATITLQPTTPPTLYGKTFNNCTALTEIRVPMSAVEAYKSATNWSEYADIIVGYE